VIWASPTLAQTITVLVLVAAALCVSLIGDDYIAPTTCTFGGECGYQAYGNTGSSFRLSSPLLSHALTMIHPQVLRSRPTAPNVLFLLFVTPPSPPTPSLILLHPLASSPPRSMSTSAESTTRTDGCVLSFLFLQDLSDHLLRRPPSTTPSSPARTRTLRRTLGRQRRGSV
jgi:hypothetical protein